MPWEQASDDERNQTAKPGGRVPRPGGEIRRAGRRQPIGPRAREARDGRRPMVAARGDGRVASRACDRPAGGGPVSRDREAASLTGSAEAPPDAADSETQDRTQMVQRWRET